jgi:DNA modification methylase
LIGSVISKEKIMDVIDLPLEQIIPYARNPRNNAEAVATVAASIQEFGWRQPIVVDVERVVLAGHTRLEAARKLGFKTAPVHVAKGLTANQARAFRIMDNRSGENAEWDKDLLNLELADLLEADFDLGLTGFTDDELSALMTSVEEGSGPQDNEDEIPDTPEDPVSRTGDLWILGHHRLLCGDSTVATDVERVLNGIAPLLMATDPPYGVEYDPGWRNEMGAAKTKRTGKVLNDDRADWREAWALFPGDVAYVWHGALHAATVAESLEDCGFTIRSQIIWAKERLVLSRGDYHWQHEPAWYAVRKSGKGHWAGDRKQTTLWHIANKDQDEKTVHGTQKPVECMRRPILNNSNPGQAVYEPFMGSGTTLIAAESTGRVCLGIELNPAYVDVAVERWQKFTGQEAVLETSGERFNDLKDKR